MQSFDASSIIHAWDNYPPEHFPPVWDWIEEKIQDEEFGICEIAVEEVSNKLPECGEWLTARGIPTIEITDGIIQEAMRIKNILGIRDRYSQRGVGENDLLIIAAASIEETELISNEARQIQLPENRSHWKIPAVCSLDDVAVPCVDFIAVIRASRRIFR